MDLKKKLAEMKAKIKENAPLVVAITTAATATATAIALYCDNQFLKEVQVGMKERFERDCKLECAWNDMMNTGEVQHIVSNQTGLSLFDMAPPIQED